MLLTEHLLCAGTVLDTGNTAMNKTDEVQALMELILGKTTMILDGAKCCQDTHWEGLGSGASGEKGMSREGLSEKVTFDLWPDSGCGKPGERCPR